MAASPGTGAAAPLCALLAKLGLLPGNCPAAEVQTRLVLAITSEREKYIRRTTAAWREGFAAGREEGFREGYLASEASHDSELDATRRLLRSSVAAVVNPGPDAARRVRAAEAGEKRDQAEHERHFAAVSHATPARLRNDVQRSAVYAYPPPARGGQVIPLRQSRRGEQVTGG